MKSWEIAIAIRYIFTAHKDRFVSIINLFSVIGIALGVATLIVVMAVMNGYEAELLDKILGLRGHMTLVARQQYSHDEQQRVAESMVKEWPDVIFAAPFIERQAMISTKHGMSGVMIKGVLPSYLWSKSKIAENLQYAPPRGTMPGIVVGIELANKLHLRPGSRLKLISSSIDHTVVGQIPRSVTLTVVGAVDFGVYEYNAGFAFIPLETAAALFDVDRATIEVELDSPYKVEGFASRLGERLPGWTVIDWQQNNQGLVQALRVEQNVMFLILSLIIMIATFNIISSLVILVKDKSKSIAILRTMGATRGSIVRIFMLCGTSIGLAGTGIGVGGGVAFAYNIDRIKLWVEGISGSKLFDPMVYFLTTLPAKIVWSEVLTVVGLSLGLSFLATIYPALKTAYIEPARALRYD